MFILFGVGWVLPVVICAVRFSCVVDWCLVCLLSAFA